MNYDRPVPVVAKNKYAANNYRLNPTKEQLQEIKLNKYRQTLLSVKKNGGLHEGNFWKVIKQIKSRGLKQAIRVEIALEVMTL